MVGTFRSIVFSFLLMVVSGPILAAPLADPQISVACYLDPTPNSRRANGYDCTVRHAVKQSRFLYDDHMSSNEILLRRNQAFFRLSLEAERACGQDCRFFYGTLGYQCLAIAQGEHFTGLGSFMGQETSQADAEHTAIRDCEVFVGIPGEKCKIIVSVCPDSTGF